MWSTSGKTNSSWETHGYDNTTRTLTGQSMFSHYPGAPRSVDIRYQSSEQRHVPESDGPRLQKRNSVTVMRSRVATGKVWDEKDENGSHQIRRFSPAMDMAN